MRRPMTFKHAVNRRRFLSLSAAAIAGFAATACGGEAAPATAAAAQPTPRTQPTASAQPTAASMPPAGATAPATVQPTAAASRAYKEAPQLADLVKAGKLPPVEGRLPKTPLVVTPVERVGQYGGAWRMGLLGGADQNSFVRTVGYENLVRWDPEWRQVIPNVAASFEAAPDAKSFTFTLREGLKWSDGQPYTADDILFWYEDISANKELTPSRGVNPPTVEKVAQHTVKFTVAQPDGLFLQNLATPNGSYATQYPAHYLKQFHKRYNITTLDQLVREAGADGWVRLFQTKGGSIPGTPYDARWQNLDLPSLHGWVLTAAYDGQNTRVTAERNPYYFKVDPEGNQLPYLDRVTFDVAQDAQVLVLKALNGEIDMQDRHIATNQNKAAYADNRRRGGYDFFETIPDSSNGAPIYLNWTHRDPIMRQIIHNKDFRIGLSHAMDRQEIIDVVFVGQGEPYQVAPRPESPYYDERFAKQYTEHDPQKAAEHLDRVLPQKDGQGFRLRPDGKRFTLQIETATAQTDFIDTLTLLQRQWQKAGIDMQPKVVDRSLLMARKKNSELDALIWTGDGGLNVVLDPSRYVPYRDGAHYAPLWVLWYEKDPKGEEPPEAIKEHLRLYDQFKAAPDQARQAALLRRILEVGRDQFYAIGTALPAKGYGIVKNNFKNVPKSMPFAFFYPTPAPTNPSQYFIQ